MKNPYETGKADMLADKVWYARAVFGEEEKEAVRKCLDDFQLSPGKRTFEFEKAVAKLYGKEYGVMVNSGSSALMMVAELLDIKPGDEIITTGSGFPTTINPFLQKGATVKLVDVNPLTLQADLDQVEKAITNKTKAIVVAHIWGALQPMQLLNTIAADHNIKLVEDSCDSIGQTIYDSPSGNWSDISVTSFFPSHVITAGGGGGMVMVKTAEEDKTIRDFRDWGRTGTDSEDLDDRFNVDLGGIPYDAKFFYGKIGYNLKATEMQAAFGLEQLKKLKGWNAKRLENYNKLYDIVTTLGLEAVYCPTEGYIPSWLAFPFLSPNRIELAKHLEKNGVQTRPILAGNFTRHPAYKDAKLEIVENLDGCDVVTRTGLGIGLHQEIGDAEISRIERALNDFSSNSSSSSE
jgi:CDP-6-deoxy-D-xylo-4-hexulose-3-dehydrase